MKKYIAIMVAVLMLFSLAACTQPTTAPTTTAPTSGTTGTGPTTTEAPTIPTAPDGRYPAETVKIGFVNYDTTAAQVLSIQRYFEYLQSAYNFEIIWSESLDSAEGELAFIEQCAAAGAKGIIGYYNVAEDVALEKAAELGMYYWGMMGGSQSVYDTNKSNPYWVGAQYRPDGDFNMGYEIGKAAVEAGYTNLVLVSGGADMGVPFFIQRRLGFNKAIEEANAAGKNITVLKDVGGWPGTEAFLAGQAEALNMDVDAICSTYTALPWMTPIANSGKDIKVFSGDGIAESTVGLMKAGRIKFMYAEIPEVFGMAIPMILNAVAGHSENFLQDGASPRIIAADLTVDNAADGRLKPKRKPRAGGRKP